MELKPNDYKLYNDRYIIYYTNWYAKEYLLDKDFQNFKGRYLNGERNG